MKYLIAGLGNTGKEYERTRHNAGFEILDVLAKTNDVSFTAKRYGSVAEMKYRGRTLILLKPSTYMNLSGNAVNYWLQAEKIPQDKLLIVLDDLALPLGTVRLKSKGSDGGHNGLKHINSILQNTNYARLRFGIGSDFPQGYQVDYVLAQWSTAEYKALVPDFENAAEAVKSFTIAGIERTMNLFNTKKQGNVSNQLNLPAGQA
ncbi:MAG: aminoacyl-tRNA hydrolase [Prevotellaceae bacterium]|jgi:PTH1 family peptidyl-tRNA hydrolase|nr:aminoacyl-tRNA hydrolase [Prevotellaceae bacterium]